MTRILLSGAALATSLLAAAQPATARIVADAPFTAQTPAATTPIRSRSPSP